MRQGYRYMYYIHVLGGVKDRPLQNDASIASRRRVASRRVVIKRSVRLSRHIFIVVFFCCYHGTLGGVVLLPFSLPSQVGRSSSLFLSLDDGTDEEGECTELETGNGRSSFVALVHRLVTRGARKQGGEAKFQVSSLVIAALLRSLVLTSKGTMYLCIYVCLYYFSSSVDDSYLPVPPLLLAVAVAVAAATPQRRPRIRRVCASSGWRPSARSVGGP